jgi:hypothetical protein
MADKYFDREEAEALLPLIGRLVGEAIQQKRLVNGIDEELAKMIARIMALGGSIPPSAEISRKRSERERQVSSLQQTVEQIQRTGCVVKDLEVGLVDFPSRRSGEEIYLCWKLGEEHIEYYHGMDEGFAGRKPLDDTSGDEPASGGSRLH